MPNYVALHFRSDAFAIVAHEPDGSVAVQISGTFTPEEWQMILDYISSHTLDTTRPVD
jgi:hypothetical protein